jgi:hypothetical protein
MVNGGGLSAATRPVSGAAGSARNDAITLCAQSDLDTTKYATPEASTPHRRTVWGGSIVRKISRAASRSQSPGTTNSAQSRKAIHFS